MECKLSPTVVVKSVTLTDDTIAMVTAEIVDMDSFRLNDEELQQYIEAYCILVADDSIVLAEIHFQLNTHLFSPDWYDSNFMGGYGIASGQKISTDFNSNTCTFEIDIENIVTPNSDGTSWSCSNMSFFAYIQINAVQMASDHEITVSGMAGNYTTGVILEDNESVEGNDIVIDMRELDDTE